MRSTRTSNARAQSMSGTGPRDDRRWLVLVVVGLAQLMVVLDVTIMNIALPSAQHALGFTDAERQWVVTAYALAFGGLLLLGGRLADLAGRKVTFLLGLVGFAVASAVGGAANGFAMLVIARACQGAFGALLAPSALSLLTTTFTDARERAKAFGVYGAIAGAGGAVGLLLGGLLTEYLSWRWCLFVNLVFAAVAFLSGLVVLERQSTTSRPRLDLPGVVFGSGAMFCVVYGFSNASTHSWHAVSTWGFLLAGVVLLAVFVGWQTRAGDPLLPPRIVLERNRGGANLAVFVAGCGMFGLFLFLTYYLQEVLRYTPVITGVAFLPMIGMIAVGANLSNVLLMPRLGPKPLVAVGMLLAAGGMAWMTGIGAHSAYDSAVLPPLLVTGMGFGLILPSSINTATFAVAPRDAGVASATMNTAQQLGGSIGTALLNTVATSATRHDLASHLSAGRPTPQLVTQALVHGDTTALWWSAAIFVGGAILAGGLLRRGPLVPR